MMKRMVFHRHHSFQALMVAALISTPLLAERKILTWSVDGVKRQAIVYSPSRGSAKAPLVFSFHAHGNTAQNFQYVNLQRAWPEATVVYPQGLDSLRAGAPGWQLAPRAAADRALKLV